MADSGFREVQLSGKQVVFLFMALAVALVGVFLLGVRAGRGAIPTEATALPAPIADASPAGKPGDLPASTPAPNELRYQETLQERPEGRGSAAATTPAPSATPPAAASAQPTAAPVVEAKPTTTPKPPAPATRPSAAAVWYVQVDSFSSRDNANTRVAELKAKGHDNASVIDAGGTGARYKVKVGPLERAAADTMFQRLRKEGYKPSPPSR